MESVVSTTEKNEQTQEWRARDTKFSNVYSHSVGDRVFIFPARATDVKAREKERTRKI